METCSNSLPLFIPSGFDEREYAWLMDSLSDANYGSFMDVRALGFDNEFYYFPSHHNDNSGAPEEEYHEPPPQNHWLQVPEIKNDEFLLISTQQAQQAQQAQQQLPHLTSIVNHSTSSPSREDQMDFISSPPSCSSSSSSSTQSMKSEEEESEEDEFEEIMDDILFVAPTDLSKAENEGVGQHRFYANEAEWTPLCINRSNKWLSATCEKRIEAFEKTRHSDNDDNIKKMLKFNRDILTLMERYPDTSHPMILRELSRIHRKCPFAGCGYARKDIDALSKHFIQRSHLGVSFRCPDPSCQKKYRDWRKMRVHVSEKHTKKAAQ